MTTNASIWLIVRKDLRRFWALLTLWCAALAVRATLDAWLGEELLSGREEGIFAMMLVVLVNIQLVCWVIAEDSPIKEGAFWRMRPITGGRMLRAKLVFLGAWTVVLPVVVAAVAGWYYGFTAIETAWVMVGQGLLHGAIGLGIGVIAMLTERILVSVVGLWFVGMVAQMTSMTLRPKGVPTGIQSGVYASVSLEWTRMAAGALILVAACGSAAAWVYARRDRRGALVALVLGATSAWAAGAFWTWDALSGVPALKRLAASENESYRVMVVRTGMESGSTVDGLSFRHLDATLQWSGAKDGEVCATYLITGRLTGADGRGIAQFAEVESAAGFDLTVALREIGIESVQGSPFRKGTEEGVTLMRLRAGDLQARAGQEATWRGEVSAKVGRVEIEARVPLKRGAFYQDGAYRFRVVDVETVNAEIQVTSTERRADTPTLGKRANTSRVVSGVMPLMYALINTERGEAVLASGGGGGGGSSDGYFKYETRTLHFGQRGDLAKRDAQEWAEWLRGAELVSFRFVEERRVKSELEVVYQP